MTYGLYSDGGVPLENLRAAVEKISFGREVDEIAARLAASPADLPIAPKRSRK